MIIITENDLKTITYSNKITQEKNLSPDKDRMGSKLASESKIPRLINFTPAEKKAVNVCFTEQEPVPIVSRSLTGMRSPSSAPANTTRVSPLSGQAILMSRPSTGKNPKRESRVCNNGLSKFSC